jgi:hypothetical protein
MGSTAGRLFVATLLASGACSRPDPTNPGSSTLRPTYDKTTGKLTRLTYDRNHDGVIDTWSDMDGARPIQTRIDQNQDGVIDRWEYYDGKGKLVKVGFSRAAQGKPDAWAYEAEDGSVSRVEVSSTADEKKIDRWEYYIAGQMVRVEEDTEGDGNPHTWETYDAGVLKTKSFDENRDGKPDRRLTYTNGTLVLIESDPDAAGNYTKRVEVK